MDLSNLITLLAEVSFIVLSVIIIIFFAMYFLLIICAFLGIDAKLEIKAIGLKMSNYDDN